MGMEEVEASCLDAFCPSHLPVGWVEEHLAGSVFLQQLKAEGKNICPKLSPDGNSYNSGGLEI